MRCNDTAITIAPFAQTNNLSKWSYWDQINIPFTCFERSLLAAIKVKRWSTQQAVEGLQLFHLKRSIWIVEYCPILIRFLWVECSPSIFGMSLKVKERCSFSGWTQPSKFSTDFEVWAILIECFQSYRIQRLCRKWRKW